MSTDRTLGGVVAYRKRTGWKAGTCTWAPCRHPTAPRRMWCSDACVVEYQIRNDPGVARACTEARDHGVCASCGLDTAVLGRHLRELGRLAREAWCPPEPAWLVGVPFQQQACAPLVDRVAARAASRRFRDGLVQAGCRATWGDPENIVINASIPHLWEMDHILPVVRGGGGCGLDNLRTLCLRCHRAETARLATERAAERRGKNDGVTLPLFGVRT